MNLAFLSAHVWSADIQAESSNRLISQPQRQMPRKMKRPYFPQLWEAKLTLAAGKAALDLAQKALAAEQRKYELGSQTIFFVLDAQTRLAQAQSDLLQAEIC